MKKIRKIDTITFSNRWSKRKYGRPSDWCIIGISRFGFSPKEYEYRICFFGFDIRIWIVIEYK